MKTEQILYMLQVCVLEKLDGLQATLLKEAKDCFGSTCITLGVSLNRGEPALLFFSLTGKNGTFSETKEMKRRGEVFQFGCPLEGTVCMGKKSLVLAHRLIYTFFE